MSLFYLLFVRCFDTIWNCLCSLVTYQLVYIYVQCVPKPNVHGYDIKVWFWRHCNVVVSTHFAQIYVTCINWYTTFTHERKKHINIHTYVVYV